MRTSPTAPALVDGRKRPTYEELDAETDRVAARRRGLGVYAEDVVAVKVDWEVEAVIAMLAAQKVGGVYLPMECAAPDERTRVILADSSVRGGR